MPENPENNFVIRLAQAADDLLISDAYRRVWTDETVDRMQIRAALQDPNHAAAVALCGAKAVGFVDGFLTISPGGVARWEIDLLGVVPERRGLGIARRLVQTSLVQAAAFSPQFARALIRVDNIASQCVFAAAGFSEQAGLYDLFVTRLPAKNQVAAPPDAALIPVQTFTYRGFWLEGDLTEKAFWAARTALWEREGLAGVLINAEQTPACRAAGAAGFDKAGAYRWWHYDW